MISIWHNAECVMKCEDGEYCKILLELRGKVLKDEFTAEQLDDLLVMHHLYDQPHSNKWCYNNNCQKSGCARTCKYAIATMLTHKIATHYPNVSSEINREHLKLIEQAKDYWEHYWDNKQQKLF